MHHIRLMKMEERQTMSLIHCPDHESGLPFIQFFEEVAYERLIAKLEDNGCVLVV